MEGMKEKYSFLRGTFMIGGTWGLINLFRELMGLQWFTKQDPSMGCSSDYLTVSFILSNGTNCCVNKRWFKDDEHFKIG